MFSEAVYRIGEVWSAEVAEGDVQAAAAPVGRWREGPRVPPFAAFIL